MAEDYTTLTHVSPLVTNERVSNALSDWFHEEHIFTHWTYANEMGKGDTYVSELIRIQIHGINSNGETNFVQVILKSIPKNIVRRLSCRSYDFFKNEINFYQNILPELIAFQSMKYLTNPFNRYMKLLFIYADGVNDVMCIEDASVSNYENAFRQDGIDVDHCRLTLEIFAQFHALSFAMKDQEPEKFTELRKTITEVYYDEPYRQWYSNFWNRLSNIAIDAVEKEYPDSIYLEKIKAFAVPDRIQDLIVAATKSTENGVICHGDSWAANFLYKYVDGHPVDAKMLDFQMSRYGSPVLDISIMIYACTDEDLREVHYDDLIRFYYDSLCNQIIELGSDPTKLYPWKVFVDEINKYSYFGLAYSLDTTPFAVLAPEDAVDMEVKGDQAVDIEEVWKIGKFKTSKGRRREASNIKHCVDRGYI